ncbi:hypothetical protein [Yoonia sp. I 8.24]|uniref:hypothetical protein n=1 Tax=Yoonia sp. I 8.24 TaxID=1537229 RepID=UPI001EDE4AF1|nr:hypothetical protein [Yoonia sp. I 8.24]MCG3267903.1 hypothetical protein [Yoonia sp. I 8.24]
MGKKAHELAAFGHEAGEITISMNEYNLLKGLATKELVRFIEDMERNKPAKRGAPQKHQYGNVDCRRAFQVWWLANNIANAIEEPLRKGSVKTRDLIHLAWRLRSEFPDFEVLFPVGEGQLETLEQSISRGRKELGIDGFWYSETCEKIMAS